MMTRLLCTCLFLLLCGIFVSAARADYSAGTPRRPGKVTVDPQSGDRKVDVAAPPSSISNQQQTPVHVYPQMGGYGRHSPFPGANSPPSAGSSAGTRPPYGARPPYGDKPSYDGRPPYAYPPYGVRPPYDGKPPYGTRPPYGDKPSYDGRPPYAYPPYGVRPPYAGKPAGAPPRPGAYGRSPFPASAR